MLQLNIFFIACLLAAFTAITLGIFVYFRGRGGIVNRRWAMLNFSVFFWSFGLAMMVIEPNKQIALFWNRIHYFGCIFIPPTFLYFIAALLDVVNRNKKIIISAYFSAIILVALNFSGLLVKTVVPLFIFKNYTVPNKLYFIFPLMFASYAIFAFRLIFKEYSQLSSFRKNQLNYITVASFIGFIGGSMTFLPVFNIPIYFGMDFVFLYPLIITVAIVRNRLMDITVAVTRTTIFVAVYTLVLGIPFAVAFLLKNWLVENFGIGSWWMGPLVLMALLATAGPFIYIYVERQAENRLLREQRRYQDTLKQASLGMTRIRNLQKLLNLITHIVTKTVRISHAAIYLHDRENDEYILQVSRDRGRAFVPKIDSSNPLIEWLISKPMPLIREEIRRKIQDSDDYTLKRLEENMQLLDASVVIPSFLEDKFMGFIVLGDKLSGQIYTADDISVFQVLASQAALAIENAQFYEEAKQMQEQIAQAEKMATVGTMADGLSHQINNRFYALSLIAGDTIDTIKLMDTSKCTPELKETIEQINYALGRIQANVMQGGEVVKGLLKYTRKGQDTFEDITIDQIIDGTLEMVQYKVRLSEIDFIRDYPKDTPKIKANLVQLEEVFFNFIDNAYDATVERKTAFKEEGYRGRITVSAKPKDRDLEIIIEDNGMGIKDDNLKKVFTPFFTTKISARKGTGLGLYVINKIITENHKGKISFESQYKVGTRFILHLPLAK